MGRFHHSPSCSHGRKASEVKRILWIRMDGFLHPFSWKNHNGERNPMSYDISLTDPKTGKVLQLDKKHDLRGGAYAMGGTAKCWLNVTYNYAQHYYRVFGEEGIRTIYGMTGAASVPVIEQAISQLGEDPGDDYWKPTEGNARAALCDLLVLANAKPEGVWKGD